MVLHFPDEPKGDLCRHGLPSSSWCAGVLSNAHYKETSERTAHSLAKSSRDGCRTIQNVSFSTRGYSLQKNGSDHSGKDHSCPVVAQDSDGENHTNNSGWQNTYGSKPWEENQEISCTQLSWIQNSWHPHQPNRTFWMRRYKSWLCKHISKSNNEKTFAEILPIGKGLFLLIFELEKACFVGKKIRATFSKDKKSGTWFKVEIIAVEGPMVVINTGASICQINETKLRRPLDTVDLEEFPDSRERPGAPVPWPSCGGQTDVWELFSDISYLSAVLDRQGLMVAAPVDLRTKKGWRLLTTGTARRSVQSHHKESQDCCHVPDCYYKSRKCGGWKKYNTLKKVSLPMDPPSRQPTQVDFPNSGWWRETPLFRRWEQGRFMFHLYLQEILR